MAKEKKAVIIKKPWGHEEIVWQYGQTTFKILHIKKGEETSLQYHDEKNEVAIPLDDNCTIRYGGTRNHLLDIDEDPINEYDVSCNRGELHTIHAGMIHQFKAVRGDTQIAELSNGTDLDITRISDKYKDKR